MGSITLIGTGGIGAPAALALVEAGVRRLRVVDDDTVELSNLHRQIFFDDADVGMQKVQRFAERLCERYSGLEIDVVEGRALPDTVMDLVSSAALVIDATDNFASRFLIADACHLARMPVVHAAAVRWHATVMAVREGGRPCYRCLFEDIPMGDAPDCATAGIVGPVCGVAGALAADRALRLLAGDPDAHGRVVSYDGLRDRLRSTSVGPRRDCPLCGSMAGISAIDARRYTTEDCEAW